MQTYLELEQIFSRHAVLGDVSGIMSWDRETIMPAGAADSRAQHLATLSRLSHEVLVTEKTAALLAQTAQEIATLNPQQQANLNEMQRVYAHASALPADLVERRTRVVSAAWQAWIDARKNNDFPSVLPHLENIIAVEREAGAAIGAALNLDAYDALLDGYDPGGRQARIDPWFDQLRRTLPSLIDEAIERQKSFAQPEILQGPYSIDTQKSLALKFAEALGFDLQRGRLDISTHPFCGGASGDVRITTRYNEQDFLSAMMGVFHEVGHALYEQNRPAAWRYQPAGVARGMGVHESQSLIFEKQACRSMPFMTYFASATAKAFNGNGMAWSAQNIYRLATKVERSFIRVDADELTYPAHIIVRYELEKAMIKGELSAKDLPGAFNEGIRKMLGLKVPDDRRGCLQDPHWYSGSFGYFPSYTLGAMMAAQFFQTACNDNEMLLPALEQGDFSPLRAWLSQHVHQKASLFSEDAIIRSATGGPLDPKIYLAHLRKRYIDHAI